jgi:hypothetical protein
MRFPVPLVIDIPDDQLGRLADATGVPRDGNGKVRAADAVDGVRKQVMAAVARDFEIFGVEAEVSIKGRS